MAIIGNGKFSPYVHSSIYHFQEQSNKSIASIKSTEGKAKIDKTIKKLQVIKEQLENEAKKFLNGKTSAQVSKELLDTNNTYTKISMEILRTKQMRDSQLGSKAFYNIKDIEKVLGYSLPKKILKMMEDTNSTQIAEDVLVNAIVDWLKNNGENFFNLDLTKQKKKITRPFKDKEVKQKMSNSLTRKLRSSQGKIKDLVIQALQESNIKAYKMDSFEESFKYFEKQFYIAIKNNQVFYEKSQTPESFLRELKINLKKLNMDYSGKSQATANLSEKWKTAVVLTDTNNGFAIDITGNMSEEDISKSENKAFSALTMMKTHHSTKKFSQTDLIITNPQGKRVRVQDKNTITILEKIKKGDTKVPQIFAIQHAQKYIDLINQLEVSGTGNLAEEDIEALSYLLANEIWFRLRGSFNKGKTGKKRKVKGNGLDSTVAAVNNLLTQEVINFLGITVEDSINPANIQVIGSGSNIFYLFANTVLVPTYKIIDDLIKQLQNVEQEIFKLQVTLNPSSVTTAGYNAKTLYEKKASSVDKLDYFKNYTDKNLVNVGVEVGEDIINTLQISRINIYTDLNTLLTSTHNF